MHKAVFLLTAQAVWAQEPLALRDAVRLALRANPAIVAASESMAGAQTRIDQARGGRLPKVNYSESFTRSDNPVYVFSSLLTQHQFGAGNFELGPLNRPDALNNFQSQLSFEQTLYDGGQTHQAVKAAGLGRQMSEEEARSVRMKTIAAAARAYYDAVLARESLKTAEQAVRSATADLKRAENVRAAGLSTDVDVLSIRVHLAEVTEQRIRRAADLDVARAALNDSLGLPLDTEHALTTGLSAADGPEMGAEQLESDARRERPELRQARLAADLARTQADSSRSLLWPQVSFRSMVELDRQGLVTRGGANWLASVSVRWNVFNGFSDKARIAEAEHSVRRAYADAQRADSAVRLQVRRAHADWRAAEERIEVARAAVAEAEESLRITQNRYEAGMSNVTDLLRNETAFLESQTRYLAAVHDQRVAALMIEFAAGRLAVDSEVLN
ncbi:MAG TPA: TolC family protein [Bryobacteraceae bacterium]|nr:TolC family protein [Bryobacteraceae bacterium]